MSTALTESGGAGQGGNPPASGNSGTNNNGAAGGGAANAAGANGAAGSGASGAGQGGAASWRDSLPDELKNDTGLQQFSDVANLAKSWKHAQSLIGKKGVIVPGEKASDEEWQAFYKQVGLPEADKYSIEAPKDSKVNADFLKNFKEQAYKMGVLPKQAKGLLDWYLGQENEFSTQAKQQQEAAQQKGLNDLKQEWGQGYDKQIAAARAAVKEFGDEKLVNYLNESGLGNDPVLIRLMAKAGALLGEDKIRGDSAGKFGKTPDEIQREINDVMGNAKHPYFDTTHPGHRTAVADMEARFKALHQQG